MSDLNADLDVSNQQPVSNAGTDLVMDVQYMPANAGMEKSAVDALLYRHPDYEREISKWEKYRCLYESESVYQFIHKHTRETEDLFRNRVNRGYFCNYVASLIDLYAAYLFRAPIVRNIPQPQASLYESFLEDADRRGSTYEEVVEDAVTFAMLDGHCGVLIDMPATDGEFASEQQRMDADHRPHAAIIRASQIWDGAVDEFGKFKWVKLCISTDETRGFDESVDTDTKTFVIWSRTDWQKWQVRNNQAYKLDSGTHSLGEVPLAMFYNRRKKSHAWFGLSEVRDIADINIAILNWSSLGDEEIFERCLNILVAERDENGNGITLGHHNVLEYPAGTTNPPAYLTPGATPLDLIAKWILNARDEIYRIAKLGGSTGLREVREATSGIAYAFEFNETNQSLAKKGAFAEKGERQILRLVAMWQGQKFDGTVEYPDEFGVEDFLTEFQILAEGRMNLTTETGIKELEKRTIRKLFARDKQGLRDTLYAEIDNAVPKAMTPDGPSFGSSPAIEMTPASVGQPGDSGDNPDTAGSDTSKSGKATSE